MKPVFQQELWMLPEVEYHSKSEADCCSRPLEQQYRGASGHRGSRYDAKRRRLSFLFFFLLRLSPTQVQCYSRTVSGWEKALELKNCTWQICHVIAHSCYKSQLSVRTGASLACSSMPPLSSWQQHAVTADWSQCCTTQQCTDMPIQNRAAADTAWPVSSTLTNLGSSALSISWGLMNLSSRCNQTAWRHPAGKVCRLMFNSQQALFDQPAAEALARRSCTQKH